MTIALLAPLGLAALAALALPILIHLVRRIELTFTDFAALRWISERVRPRRRLRFERPWLLLLRLLLLALLAVLLARPVMTEPSGPARSWVVIAPGVDRAAAHAVVADALADWRWLAPGFPALDAAAPAGVAPMASLLRELDADLPPTSALTVVVPNELAGLDGERIRLARKVDWRVVPGRMPSTVPTASTASIRLAVRYAAQDEPSLLYLRTAVAAWNVREPDRYTLDAQPLSTPIRDDEHWLVWLGAEPPAAISAWIDNGGVAVVSNHPDARGEPLWRDAEGHILAQRTPSGRGRVIGLQGALTPSALPPLLDADFPDRLLALLRDPSPAPTRATAEAMQPRTDTAATVGAARALESARPFDPWLALLIASLFLLERVVATRARAEIVE
jgi:hypothetical protein